jgi:hypothetical protein
LPSRLRPTMGHVGGERGTCSTPHTPLVCFVLEATNSLPQPQSVFSHSWSFESPQALPTPPTQFWQCGVPLGLCTWASHTEQWALTQFSQHNAPVWAWALASHTEQTERKFDIVPLSFWARRILFPKEARALLCARAFCSNSSRF